MRWPLLALISLLGGGLLLAANGGPAPQEGKPGGEAVSYAHQLLFITQNVADQYVRPVSRADLLVAALNGLYEAAHLPMPGSLEGEVRTAATDGEVLALLARTRESLKEGEPLPGPEALLASCRGLCRALDPYSAVVSGEDLRRAYGIDQQHGIGVELIENNGVGPLTIKTVFAGGPAQKAGLRPGDEVTDMDGKPVQGITAEQVQLIFQKNLLTVPVELVSATDSPSGLVTLGVRRAGVKERWQVTLERQSFKPETVLGTIRQDDNSWDYFLDRQRKLAHVRIEAIGSGTADELEGVLEKLRAHEVRGLILDLRWCPGGYLKEAVGVASLFLAEGVIAQVKNRAGQPVPYGSSPDRKVKLLEVPLVVLVNGETSGGAELIAAALQDHRRAPIAGQRTLGKASVQTSLDLGVPGMGMKLTTGTFVRPSEKNLHRFPESSLRDDWGVRPEPKLEYRLSPDLSRQLRDWWQQQSLRPGSARERLPLDDPQADPQRQAALQALRGLVK
jgi:carboxyl-terminal processing protease